MATPKSDAANDATVLLTGTHVDRLSDALRGANISINRLEVVLKDLIKSNEKVAASNKELLEEFRKGRQNGDRRKPER